MTASDNAAASASSAADATATLATLQTGADSNADEMGGNEAAYAAHAAASAAADAADAAATASAAAAAATTGDAGEAAWRMALDAQEAAEEAEATAADMAAAAIEAALTELHIDETVKTVGESSVDATTGMLTRLPDGSMITGLLRGMEPARAAAASEGQHFIQADPTASPPVATETKYKQAIAGGSLEIGKVLDTSDDKARLMLITGHQDKKTVRSLCRTRRRRAYG